MTRPLSDPIPLRDTSVWSSYDAVTILPRVYGRARIKPLRYNADGTQYVVADHAIAGVDAVTLDGSPINGWRWRNGSDLTGHAVALLELAEAPDTSANLAAVVRGQSGNPADILADLYPRADLQDFRVHCRNAGLELGGALTERMTTRAALQFVAEQAGAVWSAGLPGLAMPFPPPESDPIWREFNALDMAGWSASCELAAVVTRLTVPFAWDYAAGQATQSVVLEAVAATREHGAREAERALPWVTTARQAVAIATAWLHWRARPLWTLQFDAGSAARDIPPGAWIEVSHPRIPLQGLYVVTDLDPGYGRGVVKITAQAPAGEAPAVVIVRQSAAFAAIATEYRVQLAGDSVTLTVTDAAGTPLPGARVWIDGRGPITTDAAAKVRFRATPGRHVIYIEADGRQAVTTEVTL
ncbi:MAG: phage tail protein [Candidatus Contendobacter sp.]|nr:phage tail protein [Candidatus Contendobacter sp.]MDG4556064.1 phage tail protein [Candidatus Contendobacter sp.]